MVLSMETVLVTIFKRIFSANEKMEFVWVIRKEYLKHILRKQSQLIFLQRYNKQMTQMNRRFDRLNVWIEKQNVNRKPIIVFVPIFCNWTVALPRTVSLMACPSFSYSFLEMSQMKEYIRR